MKTLTNWWIKDLRDIEKKRQPKNDFSQALIFGLVTKKRCLFSKNKLYHGGLCMSTINRWWTLSREKLSELKLEFVRELKQENVQRCFSCSMEIPENKKHLTGCIYCHRSFVE